MEAVVSKVFGARKTRDVCEAYKRQLNGLKFRLCIVDFPVVEGQNFPVFKTDEIGTRFMQDSTGKYFTVSYTDEYNKQKVVS